MMIRHMRDAYLLSWNLQSAGIDFASYDVDER